MSVKRYYRIGNTASNYERSPIDAYMVAVDDGEWVLHSDYAALEAKYKSAVELLDDVYRELVALKDDTGMELDRGRTHWEGCESSHRTCRTLKNIKNFGKKISALNDHAASKGEG